MIEFLRTVTEPGTHVLLRVLAKPDGPLACSVRPAEDLAALVQFARSWDGKGKGVYYAINPVDEAGRPLRRRWMLVDVDGGQEPALGRGEALRAYLMEEQGWAEPIVIATGNGCHLLYRVDLPVNDGKLIRRVLLALRDLVPEVDVVVHDAARIARLPGTLNGKTKPPRPCTLVDMPARIELVSQGQLETVGGLACSVSATETPRPMIPTQYVDRVKRWATNWMARRAPAVEGKRGRVHTWNTLLILGRGYCLPDQIVRQLVLAWNETCDPPWDWDEMREKWEDVLEHGEAEWGFMLQSPTLRGLMGLPDKPKRR